MLTAAEILEWNAEGMPLTLLEVQGLVKHFPIKSALFERRPAVVRAVDNITFNVKQGETLGIVGESGCGKSTTARLLMHLMPADAGMVTFEGKIAGSPELPIKAYRRQVQMVFQDAYASRNPRLTIEDSIAFAPNADGIARAQAVRRAWSLLRRVGLDPRRFARRYPHELSGSQRQRVNIARALALEPRVLILDEPVSELDKSTAAEVLNLLLDLKEELDLTYILISRDLEVVRFIADRVMVMYLGKVAEIGPTEAIYRGRRHPYTDALLGTMLSMDPDRRTTAARLTGAPTPTNPPAGCHFHTRCRYAEGVCQAAQPALHVMGDEHLAACHRVTPGSGHSAAPTAPGAGCAAQAMRLDATLRSFSCS
jgi:peptide/nickel transport system ATP-binding protein